MAVRIGPRMAEIGRHVLLHPGCTCEDIARALSMPRSSAASAVRRCVAAGTLVSRGNAPRRLYNAVGH